MQYSIEQIIINIIAIITIYIVLSFLLLLVIRLFFKILLQLINII